MNAKLARLMVLFFPRRWRQRYGEEFEALLQSEPGEILTCLNVVWSAMGEHLAPTQKTECAATATFARVIQQPSALLPLAMSVAALTVLVGHLAIAGVTHGADEGAAAHSWQLLMVAQVPILAFFAVRWLPRAPGPTLGVLVLQAGGAAASAAPVLFLNL